MSNEVYIMPPPFNLSPDEEVEPSRLWVNGEEVLVGKEPPA